MNTVFKVFGMTPGVSPTCLDRKGPNKNGQGQRFRVNMFLRVNEVIFLSVGMGILCSEKEQYTSRH